MKKMTISEVLAYLEIGRSTFYIYRDKGMPVHYTLSKRPHCFKEEIDEWLSRKPDKRRK